MVSPAPSRADDISERRRRVGRVSRVADLAPGATGQGPGRAAPAGAPGTRAMAVMQGALADLELQLTSNAARTSEPPLASSSSSRVQRASSKLSVRTTVCSTTRSQSRCPSLQPLLSTRNTPSLRAGISWRRATCTRRSPPAPTPRFAPVRSPMRCSGSGRSAPGRMGRLPIRPRGVWFRERGPRSLRSGTRLLRVSGLGWPVRATCRDRELRRLSLTADEKGALLAFLKSLSGQIREGLE